MLPLVLVSTGCGVTIGGTWALAAQQVELQLRQSLLQRLWSSDLQLSSTPPPPGQRRLLRSRGAVHDGEEAVEEAEGGAEVGGRGWTVQAGCRPHRGLMGQRWPCTRG